MKRVFGATVGYLVLGATAALAQSTVIPEDLLNLDRQRCMTDCTPNFGETTCKPLCDCTVAEFKKRFDFSQYLELSAQLSRNEVTPPNRTVLDAIAKQCTAALDQAGVEVGGSDGTGGTN